MDSPRRFRVVKNWPKVAPQIVTAVSASWATFCTGLVRGWSSPALPILTKPNNHTLYLDPDNAAWIASLPPLCALVGSLFISLPMQLYGRRWTLIGICIPFLLGFYAMGISHYTGYIPLLYAGRIITGFVSGASVPTAQIYVSECSSPRIRGALGSFTATFLAMGILIAYTVGSFVDWYILSFIIGSFPLLLGLAMFFMPETPPWLISHHNDEKAKEALQHLRGKHTNVEDEFQRMKKNSQFNETDQGSRFQGLTSPCVLKPLMLSVALMVFQQLSGINAIIYYAVLIFQKAGTNIDRYVSSIVIGVVQLVCTLLSVLLIDRFGRRILLVVSGTFMALSLCSLATFFYLKSTWDVAHFSSFMEWIPLGALVVFIIAYSAGFSSIPYVLMGELFPVRYRNLLGSVSTSFNLGTSFVIIRTFTDMSYLIGLSGIFWLYSSFCLLSVLFVLLLLPETKGRTLEDISQLFLSSKDLEKQKLSIRVIHA